MINELIKFFKGLWPKKHPKGTFKGSRCSGYRVYPGGEKCGGCSDCEPRVKEVKYCTKHLTPLLEDGDCLRCRKDCTSLY